MVISKKRRSNSLISTTFIVTLLITTIILVREKTNLFSFGKTPINNPPPVAFHNKIFEVVPNNTWPGDYLIKEKGKSKTLVYMSAKYNRGRITDLKALSGNQNLIANTPSSGAFYPKFILWPEDNQWSDGYLESLENFEVTKTESERGGFVEWQGVWKDNNLGFVNTLIQRIYPVKMFNKDALVIYSRTTLKALKVIRNIKHLYVELGWHANEYQNIVADTTSGIKSADLTGNPGVHYFDGLVVKKGNWISNRSTTTLDGYLTMFFLKSGMSNSENVSVWARSQNRAFARSWDTFNTLQTDITDTMEFHLTDPTKTYSPPYPYHLMKDDNIYLEYLVVITDHELTLLLQMGNQKSVINSLLLYPYPD